MPKPFVELPADFNAFPADMAATLNDRLERLSAALQAIQTDLDRVKKVYAIAGAGSFTITLAKLTGGGAAGSITWNDSGAITKWTAPT